MSKQNNIKRHIASAERRYHDNKNKNRWGALFSLGWRVAIEWAAAVLAGYGLGYAVDAWLNTRPFGMIIFLLLGNVAGLLNIYRTYKNDIKVF